MPTCPSSSNAVGEKGIPAVIPRLVMMGANTSAVVMATVKSSSTSTSVTVLTALRVTTGLSGFRT